MNRSSPAPYLDARETSDEIVDHDATRERLRARLAAAAEEEAAAIVEDARNEILATVRRARRDLLRVRTRVQLYGPEARTIADDELEAFESEQVAASPPLGDKFPPDAGVVGHTNALRHVVGEAATELEALSAASLAVPLHDEFELGESPAFTPSPGISAPGISRPQVIVTTIVALSVVTGIVVWIAAGEEARSVARDPVQAATPSPVQASSEASIAPATPDESATAQVANETTPTAPAPAAAPAAPPTEPAQPAQPAEGRTPTPAFHGGPQSAIFAKHVEWFDAFGRGDRQAMAGLLATGFSLRDERAGRSANADAGASTPIQVSDIRIAVSGTGAVLTGRLRDSVGGVPTESLLSEVWVRDEQQQWALMGVRIVPADRVPRPAR